MHRLPGAYVGSGGPPQAPRRDRPNRVIRTEVLSKIFRGHGFDSRRLHYSKSLLCFGVLLCDLVAPRFAPSCRRSL